MTQPESLVVEFHHGGVTKQVPEVQVLIGKARIGIGFNYLPEPNLKLPKYLRALVIHDIFLPKLYMLTTRLILEKKNFQPLFHFISWCQSAIGIGLP